ncbi:MAG: flavodoxin [Bacteroidales bacterium]|nr:flavodoxin [Bacteroidales bacterium]
MKKIGIFYSFNTTKTGQAVKMLSEALGKENVETVNAETVNKDQVLSYDNMIFGVPTWFDGELPNYWDEFVPELEDMNLKGKKMAIFGNGDQKNYPENFVDGIGIMADLLESRGAEIVGLTSAEGYHFESSRALRGDKFAGLALDFENQPRQNKERIGKWAEQLQKEFL